MLALKIKITAYVADGCVECKFHDAENHEHTIHAPADLFDLKPDSSYPQEEFIVCQFLGMYEHHTGRNIILIDTASTWSLFTLNGKHQFEIWPEHLVDID
jgi:hypothetical protein